MENTMLKFDKLSFNISTLICSLILGISSSIRAEIAAGGGFTLAVDKDKNVWAFGAHDKGQLGQGEGAEKIALNPIQIAILSNISKIAAGKDHAIAIDNDGQVWVWGTNDHGQLGLGDRVQRSTPTLIEGFSGAIQAAAGWFHTLVLDANGDVWAFGHNKLGALGNPYDSADQRTLQRVKGLQNIIQIAAGANHSVALDVNGDVWTFGQNDLGQLGHKTIKAKKLVQPTQVKDLHGIAKIAAGAMQTFAIGEDGQVFGFGNNTEYQLGILSTKRDPTTTNRYEVVRSPKSIPGLSGITQITTNLSHTIALNQEGQILAFGKSCTGILGLGNNVDDYQKTPALIPIPAEVKIVEVSAGLNHSIALDNTGQLWTFGHNALGALGHGDRERLTSPKMIENLLVPMQVPSVPQVNNAMSQ